MINTKKYDPEFDPFRLCQISDYEVLMYLVDLIQKVLIMGFDYLSPDDQSLLKNLVERKAE